MRAAIAAAKVADGRVPIRSRQQFTLDETNEKFPTTVYELEPKSGGDSNNTYTIARSRRIPFNFATVRVTSSTGIEFRSRLTKILLNDHPGVPRRSDFNPRVEQTWQRVAKSQEREPNWQLWRPKSAKPLWAEYGGTIANKVVLRDKDAKFHSFDRKEFDDDEDVEAIARGRQWYSSGNTPFFRGELLKVESKAYRFVVLDDGPNRGKHVLRQKSEFAEVDKACIGQLLGLLPKPEPLPAIKPISPAPTSIPPGRTRKG